MIATVAFHDRRPVIPGRLVHLRPFRPDDLDALWDMLCDEEGARLTGTHTAVTRAAADRWYRSRGEDSDRLDLAIATAEDDRCVGEVVLNGLDPANRSCAFRISLIGPSVYGRGYGTEATRLILAHAFDTVGLHRVALEVYDLNPRARHVYDKLGFVVEGVLRDALWWEDRFHDAIAMSMLAPEWERLKPGP
jgi:RimJ/RimL family protein N-acetyltransferase